MVAAVKVVLVLGAGATVSDVATRPLKVRPPLDRHFFSIANKTNPSLVGDVARYMKTVYAVDLLEDDEDSLEKVMGRIYTDMFNPALEKQATDAFRALLSLFTRRLATTTNDIEPTNKRWLYRIIAAYLSAGINPSDITVITFNQDIQVEKTLCLMSGIARWKRFSDVLFNFPNLYCLGERDTTSPISNPNAELFEVSDSIDGCLKVLKLHGSLNWYSTHNSPQPPPSAMFKSTRKLRVTRRRIIVPQMTFTQQKRTYALPVVVPPVTHKSAVLHDDVRKIWRLAEEALDVADELLIFGYSCPPLDFESANQLQRSQRKARTPKISVIDPDGGIAARYIELLRPTALSYFDSAKSFLEHH